MQSSKQSHPAGRMVDKPSLHVVPVALTATSGGPPLLGNCFNLRVRDGCAIKRESFCDAVEQASNSLQDRAAPSFFHEEPKIAFPLCCIRPVAVAVDMNTARQNLFEHGGSPSSE